MSSGVQLLTGKPKAPVSGHVHLEHDGWCITSKTYPPTDPTFLTTDLLDISLPGPLGCFLYPKDAVFHVKEQTHTTKEMLDNWMHTYHARCRASGTPSPHAPIPEPSSAILLPCLPEACESELSEEGDYDSEWEEPEGVPEDEEEEQEEEEHTTMHIEGQESEEEEEEED